ETTEPPLVVEAQHLTEAAWYVRFFSKARERPAPRLDVKSAQLSPAHGRREADTRGAPPCVTAVTRCADRAKSAAARPAFTDGASPPPLAVRILLELDGVAGRVGDPDD